MQKNKPQASYVLLVRMVLYPFPPQRAKCIRHPTYTAQVPSGHQYAPRPQEKTGYIRDNGIAAEPITGSWDQMQTEHTANENLKLCGILNKKSQKNRHPGQSAHPCKKNAECN
jgi:hypothetical protein